jgi:octaprenyl-diphosphate synthase
VGDYLLSRGLLMSLEYNDYALLKITSNAVKLMSEGELLQMEKARRLNIDEPVYFEIIRQKTASLIASCTAVGAASASTDAEHIEKMRLIGEKVGMAFQIKDDLLDYGTSETGKPKGIDLKEKKMTLPLIHTLNKASWMERRKLINIVRNHNTDPKRVRYLLDFVAAQGGITYSQATMNRYLDEALESLRTLPDSPARQAFEELVYYTIEREN